MRDWLIVRWKQQGMFFIENVPAAEDKWDWLGLDRGVAIEVVAALYSKPLEVAEAITAIMRIKR